MKRYVVAVLAGCLALGLASCTGQGNTQSEKATVPGPTPSASCDQPYVVSDGESAGTATFVRIDKYYDQDLPETLLDKKAASSISWDPQPAWDNHDDVLRSVAEVSPVDVAEQTFPYVEGFNTLVESTDTFPGLLGYYAATPTSYEFKIQCHNDQENWYKLSFSTWTDSDLGLLDCNVELDSKAPSAAHTAYEEYCQES